MELEWLTNCQKLPLIDGNKLSDALVNHTKVAKLYHICSARQKDLAESIKAHNKDALKQSN